MQKKEIKAKQRARQLAVQSLYQWSMTQQPVEEIEAQFFSMNDMEKIDGPYFSELLRGILLHLDEIDTAFTPFLDRPINELQPVELSVLRVAGYELMFSLETPYRIILDESVNLAKTFGAQDGYRYVNGVLNQLAKVVRQVEISMHHG
ncbi:MAG: transcription antitermination factor NusB [Gammaproteobacteria bacterium]|nr:transcription antitermination factor NusB [Gammaproteobacteria bacterium]